MMPQNLNAVLSQFEAVEANLSKLQRIWQEMQPYLATANSNSFNEEHERAFDELLRAFRHIATTMPKIDGYELTCEIDCYNDVFMGHVEANEAGGFESLVVQSAHSAQQGKVLNEYRFRFDIKRRDLARGPIQELYVAIEELLVRLAETTVGWDGNKSMPSAEWDGLRQSVKSIDALLGSGVQRGGRWGYLSRHLHFGLKGDFDDIVKHDWPSVKEWLDSVLYGPNDPVPVNIGDLGHLVATEPTGPIATRLKWESLSDAEFERLIFNLISQASGYENPQWLTHTNAPDRGRDLSVERMIRDPLTGSRKHRVIVACKHWQSRSVGLPEIMTLKEQMRLWEPPRVDFLIIASTGRFTTDAVQWSEGHNQSNVALQIELWPDSHLERLLAERPGLIAEFRLRGGPES